MISAGTPESKVSLLYAGHRRPSGNRNLSLVFACREDLPHNYLQIAALISHSSFFRLRPGPMISTFCANWNRAVLTCFFVSPLGKGKKGSRHLVERQHVSTGHSYPAEGCDERNRKRKRCISQSRHVFAKYPPYTCNFTVFFLRSSCPSSCEIITEIFSV